MVFRLKKSVVLVGMMGAGKTAVGKALARQLGVEIRDSDVELARAANMSIPEIFARDGEDFFRQREAEVLARLLHGAPGILATGGGAYLLAKNRAIISQAAVALWLKADFDLLWARVRHKNTRPLLQVADPRQALRRLCEVREKSYRLAELVVSARADYSIGDMAGKVIDVLLVHDEILERR